ncbi:MAG: Ig-like domain-containing protein, partial [Acidobacteriaceae bacterium]
NITIPSYQQRYMTQYPPVPGGHPSISVLLNGSGTRIRVSTSPSGTVPYNQPVTLTATVTPGLGSTPPTGSVIFEDFDGTPMPAVPLSGGTATLLLNNVGTGRHRYTALYSGDVLYQPNTAAQTSSFQVAGTPVTLTVPENPITPTTVVTYTVTVGTAKATASNPVGTVSMFGYQSGGTVVQFDGPNAVGTPGKGGIATFTKTLRAGVPPGHYYLYAVFTPGAGSTYAAGSSPQLLVISQ